MKRNTKGLTSIEVIIIIAIIIIIGVIVYLSSSSTGTVSVEPQVNNVVTNNNVKASPDAVNPVATTKSVTGYDDAHAVLLAKQLKVDAESRFTGTYSNTFTKENSAKTVGSGLVVSPGTVGKEIVDEATAKKGNIFAITNSKLTAYAVYSSLPSKEGSFFCMASDGSSKDVTSKVTDIAGLLSKPICK